MDADYVPAVQHLFDSVEAMIALWCASKGPQPLHALLDRDQTKPDQADFVGMMTREVVELYERITLAQRTGDAVCAVHSSRRIVFEHAFLDTAKPTARLACDISAMLRKAFIVNPALVANLDQQLKRKAKTVSIASADACDARYKLEHLEGEVEDACQRAIDSGYDLW